MRFIWICGKFFVSLRVGGWVRYIEDEVFLNYSQRINTFITNKLYRTYRGDENNSKKDDKKFGYVEFFSYIYIVND